MKRIAAILALFFTLALNAQIYTNWPSYLAPVATPFSAYWTLTATDAVSGLTLLGGNSSGSATNAIGNLNGTGTNTTLTTAKSIVTTNLNVVTDAWLNNSNLHLYYLSAYAQGGLIPQMVNSNLPSGLASASSQALSGLNPPFQAFKIGASWTAGSVSNTAWIQYQFPSPVLITKYSGVFALGFNSGRYDFQASQDGSTWTTLDFYENTNHSGNFSVTNDVVNFYGAYFRWITTNTSGMQATVLQVYPAPANVISNSVALSIIATNGAAINTGGIGLTVDGMKVGSSQYYGTFSQLFVSGGTGAGASYNGVFTASPSGNYYTNSLGYVLFLIGNYSINSLQYGLSFYQFATNFGTLAFTNQPSYSSPSLFATYSPLSSGSPGTLIVSPVTNSTVANVAYTNAPNTFFGQNTINVSGRSQATQTQLDFRQTNSAGVVNVGTIAWSGQDYKYYFGDTNGNLVSITASNFFDLTGVAIPLATAIATNTDPRITMAQSTNMASTYYFGTNALYFAYRSTITNLNTRANLIGFENELGYSMTNLIDAVLLGNEFNYTNAITFKGQPFFSSNLISDTWGVLFSNSLVRVDNLPDCRTSTVVIVRQYPDNIASGAAMQFVAGMGNTNTGDAVYVSTAPASWLTTASHVSTTMFGDGVTNMVIPLTTFNGVYDFQWTLYTMNERVIDFLSLSNRNVFSYQNGFASKANFSSPNTSPVIVGNVGALTSLSIGQDVIAGGTVSSTIGNNPFYGRIKAVLVFNCPMTPALALTITKACQWLEPETTVRKYVSDSRWIAFNNFETNSVPWFFQQTHPGEHSWGNLSKGGTGLTDLVGNTNVVFGIPMISRNVLEVVVGHGINDIYFYTMGWPVLVSNLTVFSRQCAQYGATLRYVTPWTTWTNAGNGYSTTPGYSNYNAFIANLSTNPPPNIKITRGDLAADQWTMNTNNGISSDGLHQYTTNGWKLGQLTAAIYDAGLYPTLALLSGASSFGGLAPASSGGPGSATNISQMSQFATSPWFVGTNSAGTGLALSNRFGVALTVLTNGNVTILGDLQSANILNSGIFDSDMSQFVSDGNGNVTAVSYLGDGGNLTGIYAPNISSRAVYTTNYNGNGVLMDSMEPITIYRTNASYTVGGFNGLVAGDIHQFANIVTNYGASSITVTMPASGNPFGTLSTNVVTIPAGGMAHFNYEIHLGAFTNYNNYVIKPYTNSASAIGFGTLADARLSGNVALKVGDNIFTNNGSVFTVTNVNNSTGVGYGTSVSFSTNGSLIVNATSSSALAFFVAGISRNTIQTGAYNAQNTSGSTTSQSSSSGWFGSSNSLIQLGQIATLNGSVGVSLSEPAIGTWYAQTNVIVQNLLTSTNGFLSLSSNLLAPSSITFPATGVNWTNSTGRNVNVYIDTTGVTGTTTSINGSQIYSALVGDMRLDLQNGEYFSMVYTIGTPTAKIKPQ